jgi:nicotinate-nucleotide adenylyltransferase
MSLPPDATNLPIAPWPLGLRGRDAIIVGGTFDPPHAGHVALAAAARDARAPGAGLVFVPAHRSPFKQGAREQTIAAHRVAMLRLAIRTVPNAAVWTDEIDRGARAPEAASYTINTLTRAKQVAAEQLSTLWIMLGADQMAQLHRWREPRGVLSLARPIVLLRPPLDTVPAMREAMAGVMEPSAAHETSQATQHESRAAVRRFWSEAELDLCCRDTVALDPRFAPISSSAIRSIIADRGVAAVPHGWLAPEVATYIGEHGLYQR